LPQIVSIKGTPEESELNVNEHGAADAVVCALNVTTLKIFTEYNSNATPSDLIQADILIICQGFLISHIMLLPPKKIVKLI
jgi:hypothetical protein